MAIATFSLVALDCPDPEFLAGFYQQITGGELITAESPEWVRLRTGAGVDIGFQQDLAYEAPDWPDGSAQQAHLDFEVADLDTAEAQLVELGATKTLTQPEPDEWRVFLDPVGHPFCLVKP